MTTLAIVGSRHYFDTEAFTRIVAERFQPKMGDRIVSGGQTGADTLAREYALARSIPFTEYPESAEIGAFVQRCRKRNQKVADAADVMLALPCRHSKGTYDAVCRFERKGGKAVLVEVECGS